LESLQALRTILALEPGLIAESLRSAFAQHPEIDVLCEAHDALSLLLAARQHEPSVVVMGMSRRGGLPAVGSHLLAEFPELLIVGIDSRGESAFTFRNTLQFEELSIGNVQQFVSRLRSSAIRCDHTSDTEWQNVE
jgi:DNA-binding NarL/FixJ family response regulator